MINFDPVIEKEGGKRLHEVCKWTDPRKLTETCINDLRECSGGMVVCEIAEWKDVDAFPVKKDGFRYTDDEFLKCFRAKGDWHQPDAIDYHAIIREFGLDRRVERREIDEVWLWGFPYSGMWESTMAGKGAYDCNSPPVEGINTSRIFVIMGFNYERGVGEMLEDFGHRTESIMRHVFRRWDYSVAYDLMNPWERFTLYDKIAPGKAACGNVHFAPNSDNDYDWGNRRTVSSTCDDWLEYPRLNGAKRLVNCSDWGNGDIREHHKWWLKHLPHARGRSGGKLNNWWEYLFRFNLYRESR